MPNIVVSSQTHWLPLLKQLTTADVGPSASQDHNYNIISLQPQYTKLLADIDVPAHSLMEYLTDTHRALAIHDASAAHGNLLSQSTPGFSDSPALTDWFTKQGLAHYFYPRLLDLALALRAFISCKPDLFIVHNDVEPLLRLLALYAVNHNIPVLHVPHAIYFDTPERGPIGSDIHDTVTAQYLAAAGPFQAQWYTDRSVGKQKIYLTGVPQFDRLYGKVKHRDTACRLLHLDPYKPVLVYMSSWAQNTNLLGCHDGVESTYLNVLAAVKELPDVQLVVKCHPRGQNTQWHIDEARKAQVVCAVTHQHLDTVLQAADVILSYGASNVVLEAACLPDMRLIAIDGFADDKEIINCSTDKKEILTAIAIALTQPAPDLRNFIYKYLGQMDGQATTRVIKLIKEIMQCNYGNY